MKITFKLAAALIAASVLGACSGGGPSALPSTLASASIRNRTPDLAVPGTVCPQGFDNSGTGYTSGGGYVSNCEPSSGSTGCVVTCSGAGSYPTGTGVGMPGPGGMGGCLRDPSNCVATADPAVGLDCDGSQSHGTPIKLGTSNLPGGTSGVDTSVVNIYSIQDANFSVAGWAYKTENGNLFWEGNPNAADTVKKFINVIAPLGTLVDAVLNATNNPTQESSSTLQIILNAEMTGGFHKHACFNKDLPKSALV